MQLFESSKKFIENNKDGKIVPKLEVIKVVLIVEI